MRPSYGLAALLAGTASIALGVIAAKQAYLDGVDPQSLVAARFVLAIPVIVVFLLAALRALERPPGAASFAVGLAAGAVLWLAARAEFEGLTRLPAGMLVLMLATLPVWVAFLGWVWLRRVPTRVERVALVVVVGGVAVMAAPIGASINPLGVLFGLVSAISGAVFLLLLERNRRMPASVGFLLGALGAAVAVLLTAPGVALGIADGPALGLLVVVGLSFALWALLVGMGLGATDSVTTAIVIAVEPLLVGLLALALLGEGLSARELAGGAIVLLAVTAVAVQVGRDGKKAVPLG